MAVKKLTSNKITPEQEAEVKAKLEATPVGRRVLKRIEPEKPTLKMPYNAADLAKDEKAKPVKCKADREDDENPVKTALDSLPGPAVDW